MKKTVLSLFAMAAATLSMQAKVGDDLTSKYLQNADFSQDTPVTGRICTYDYDMGGGTYTMFGQQAVSGWTALNPSDNIQVMANSGSPAREDGANARAAGVFAIGAYTEDEVPEHVAELGGPYYAPDFNSNGDEATGKVLGMVAVWGATVQYTQTVTLPAGCYTIQIPTYNGGGAGTVSANLCGFIADNGKKYLIDKTSWAVETDEPWAMDEVTFILDEETSGVISLGYTGPAGSGSMPHLFFDYVKILEADPAPVIKAEVDALKEDLLPLLQDGDELGVDTKAGWTVYNDDNATLAQVQEAIDNQKEINKNAMTDFTDFFLNNAHFNLGTPLDNGVCTYAKDMTANETTYFGMQPIPSWTASDPGTDAKASGLFAVGSGETAWMGSRNQGYVAPETKANGATEGNVFGFVGCWSASASYTQNVTLPAGSYTITIPTYNSKGGTTAIAKNLCGFIAADGTEYLAETKVFTVNKWTNETIKFTLEEETAGVISIGYAAANAGSGSMPHLFIDEFTLKYNGKLDVDPSLLALQGAVRTAEEYLYGEYEAALEQQLEEAVKTGQGLVTSKSDDAEANTKAATALNNLVAEIRISIAAYEDFDTFVKETLPETIAEYEGDEDMVELKTYLEDTLLGECESALADFTYNTTQINETIAGLDSTIIEYTQKAFDKAATDGKKHNLNVTRLIKQNISFANRSLADWTAEAEGSSAATPKFESQVDGVTEFWSGNAYSYRASVTLTELPAGVYKISAPGFFRNGSVADNYAKYTAEEEITPAYLFANLNQVAMHNQAEMAAEEQDDLHNGDASGAFLPNGQAVAQKVFRGETDYDMTNTVTTVLSEGADLKIGAVANMDAGGSWVCWGPFTITYVGVDAEAESVAYDEQIDMLIDKATEMQNVDAVTKVNKAMDDIDTAISAGTAAKDGDVAAKKDAIEQLSSAIKYANACEPALNKWMETAAMYDKVLGLIEFESEDSKKLDELLGLDPEDGVESVMDILQIINAFPEAWSNYALGQADYKAGMATASEANPFEITDIILNASFEDTDSENGMGLSVWNVEATNGDTGIKENANATYTMAGCDGDYLFNTWNGGAVGYAISQDIYLPAGYYTLKCVVATDADKQVSVNASSDHHIVSTTYTMADGQDEEGNVISAKAIGVQAEITFGSEGEVIELGASGVDTWYKVDNFQLFYLGATAPTGVEAVAAQPTKSAGIFDLAGRKLSKAVKGIYIINGKKVVK